MTNNFYDDATQVGWELDGNGWNTMSAVITESTTKIEKVEDDTTPKLSGRLDLNSQGIVQTFTAAEALSSGDLCYLNSSGEMAKADATDDSASTTLVALCTESISLAGTGKFLLTGLFTTSGLTTGSNYYIGTTAGAITTTAPSATGNIVRIIGTAISTTQLFFNPDRSFVEV